MASRSKDRSTTGASVVTLLAKGAAWPCFMTISSVSIRAFTGVRIAGSAAAWDRPGVAAKARGAKARADRNKRRLNTVMRRSLSKVGVELRYK